MDFCIDDLQVTVFISCFSDPYENNSKHSYPMTSAFIHKAGPELKHLGPFDLLKDVEQRLKREQSFRVVDNSFGSCFGYMFFSLTELSSRHLGFLDRGRFTLDFSSMQGTQPSI